MALWWVGGNDEIFNNTFATMDLRRILSTEPVQVSSGLVLNLIRFLASYVGWGTQHLKIKFSDLIKSLFRNAFWIRNTKKLLAKVRISLLMLHFKLWFVCLNRLVRWRKVKNTPHSQWCCKRTCFQCKRQCSYYTRYSYFLQSKPYFLRYIR